MIEKAPLLDETAVAARDVSYRRIIEDYRKRRLPTIVANTAACHARIVICNLLVLASEDAASIRLVSGRLAAEVYGELGPMISEAIDGGCDLRVITECGRAELTGNQFYQVIHQKRPDSIRCMGIQSTTRQHMQHYMLVGETAYRVEFDDLTRSATACFNDERRLVTGILSRRFEEAWDSLAKD